MSILFERQFDAGRTRDSVDCEKPLVEVPNRNGNLADLEYLEQCLEQEQRTYNSEQLAKKLATERQVQLSPERQ